MESKKLLKRLSLALGYRVKKVSKNSFADESSLEKGSSSYDRFREVISDPLNILIKKVANAGFVDKNNCVILHNGHRVPILGPFAYYEDFSELLIFNRGVHEPLEEYCFQEVLKRMKPGSPVMIELGAYWGHYSMWLMKEFDTASCYLIEPDENNISSGKYNFKLNGYKGEFIKAFVGMGHFQLDEFISERQISHIDIIHADIQGYEIEMLAGAKSLLSNQTVDYIFVSTHSEDLHTQLVNILNLHGYRIEVSSGFDSHTTSCDGFVLATSQSVEQVFNNFDPLGRVDIANSSPAKLLNSINFLGRT